MSIPIKRQTKDFDSLQGTSSGKTMNSWGSLIEIKRNKTIKSYYTRGYYYTMWNIYNSKMTSFLVWIFIKQHNNIIINKSLNFYSLGSLWKFSSHFHSWTRRTKQDKITSGGGWVGGWMGGGILNHIYIQLLCCRRCVHRGFIAFSNDAPPTMSENYHFNKLNKYPLEQLSWSPLIKVISFSVKCIYCNISSLSY